MDALAVVTVFLIIIWFAGYGSHRSGALRAPLWALLGVVVWAVGYYIAFIITEQLLSAAGSAIATNGVAVVSKLAGISAGVGLCYLAYRAITVREQVIASRQIMAPSSSTRAERGR
jgi:hypothetical protein